MEMTYTAYYIIIISALIFLNILCPFLKIYWYFAFSIKQIKENHQYWRFITNYLIKARREVNLGTFFDLVSLYIRLYNLEIKAIAKKKYSKFIMIIIIESILNTIGVIFLSFKFNIKESRSLIKELSYSLLAISSYRYPNEKIIINYIPLKKKWSPIAIIISDIYFNKDISLETLKSPLVGFVNGFIFCLLAIKLKIKFIPPFLKKLLNEPSDEERKIRKEQIKQLKKEILKFEKMRKKLKKEMAKKELEEENNNENGNENENINNQQNDHLGNIPNINNNNNDNNNFRMEDYIGTNDNYHYNFKDVEEEDNYEEREKNEDNMIDNEFYRNNEEIEYKNKNEDEKEIVKNEKSEENEINEINREENKEEKIIENDEFPQNKEKNDDEKKEIEDAKENEKNQNKEENEGLNEENENNIHFKNE